MNRQRASTIVWFPWIVACFVQPTHAVDYDRDIKPLLAEKCVACHGSLNQESGLRLDHGSFIRQGSGQGKILDLDSPAESEILARVMSDDTSVRMPPEGDGSPMSPAQVQLLADWIREGANSPEQEPLPVDPDQHWAWQPVVRPHVPTDVAPENISTPVDAFVFSNLQQHSIQPAAPAEPATLLRRVYFDLVGLPPSMAEQDQFRLDPSEDAWEQLVERLLGNPAHGERWARHWMDVWRYSDWAGYKEEVRDSQRHIWRWRDWIIQSLNEDKGYDQMIVEMLAGDEWAPDDADVLRATGFLARNYHNSNRNIWLDSTVEHTAKAFLALTINCARCHDHKYDPLSQHDYYAFRAIFEPHHVRTERVPGQANMKTDGLVRAYDAKPEEPTYLYVSGDEKRADKDHPITANVPAIFARPLDIAAVPLPSVAVFPALHEYIQREDLARARQKLQMAHAQVGTSPESPTMDVQQQQVAVARAELASLEARWKADRHRYATHDDTASLDELRQIAIDAEHAAKLANAQLLVLQKQEEVKQLEANAESGDGPDKAKGESDRLQKAQTALQDAEQTLEKLGSAPAKDAEYTSVGTAYPATSTGRRLALARWIASPENPLTARVAVNYVWMHHFGRPLVTNVFDFGLRSMKPVHQDLLDWLSVELIESGWSFKHLHRLIVNSKTYRLQSSADMTPETNRQQDANNELWWRSNVRRLEAEAIRDSLLHAASSLDRTQGGPEIDYEGGESIPRRSVYFRHAYEKQMKMLVLFDAASPNECYRRSPSVVPQQALALANSPLAFDQARRLAAQLSQEFPNDSTGFVQSVFHRLLGRASTPAELTACEVFLQQQQDLYTQQEPTPVQGITESQIAAATEPAQRARESLIHALFNHNDFITVR